MRRWCLVEIFRRFALHIGLGAGLFISFVLHLSGTGWMILFLSLGIYIFMPRENVPKNAHAMEFLPAIFAPDLVSAILIVPMLVLTLASYVNTPMPAWWMVAMLVAPLIICGLLLSWIIIRNACLRVQIEQDQITLSNWQKTFHLTHHDIAKIRPHTFKLPNWVWAILVLFGGPREAGAALLHSGRNSQYLKITLSSGTTLTLPLDGFAHPEKLALAFPLSGVKNS